MSTEEKVSLRVGNWTSLSAGGPHTEARGLTRFWIPAARGPSASHGHSHGASLLWRSLSWSLAAWLALHPPGPPVRPDLRERPPSSPRVAPGARGRGGGHTLGRSCSGSSWRNGGPSTPAPRCKTLLLERGCRTNFTTFPRLSWGQSFLLLLRNAREGVHPRESRPDSVGRGPLSSELSQGLLWDRRHGGRAWGLICGHTRPQHWHGDGPAAPPPPSPGDRTGPAPACP